MPLTRNAMAAKNMRLGKKYRSKKRNQDIIKSTKILNREKRLKNFGWSLLMFN